MFVSSFLSVLLLAVPGALSHGDHGGNGGEHNAVKTKPEGLTWEQWHMIEEHGLSSYDTHTLFRLHDISNNGVWLKRDILYLYGLHRESVIGDGSGMGVHEQDEKQEIISQDSKDNVISTILGLIDTNNDGMVSFQELHDFFDRGGKLPDFGYGQGHHLDFESEYEEHHWNKYHKDQDPDTLVKHKEDIEHEMLHHEHEIEQTHRDDVEFQALAQDFKSQVRIENVPDKYRS